MYVVVRKMTVILVLRSPFLPLSILTWAVFLQELTSAFTNNGNEAGEGSKQKLSKDIIGEDQSINSSFDIEYWDFIVTSSESHFYFNQIALTMIRSSAQKLIRMGPRATGSRTTVQAVSVRGFSSSSDRLSYERVPKEDFGKFKEYSVIHTNRSLNLMSDPFQKVMRDLNALLKETYNADKVAILPG